MYILRQFCSQLAVGDVGADEYYLPVYQNYDVQPYLKPKIEPGKNIGAVITLAAAGTYLVQLPNDYDTENRLFVLISAQGVCRCVLVSPAHATSTILIKGESSARPGIYSVCERVSSITLSNPTATAFDVQVSTYELPDLSLSASFSNGPYAFNGVSV
jgi:hypothetical protein